MLLTAYKSTMEAVRITSAPAHWHGERIQVQGINQCTARATLLVEVKGGSSVCLAEPDKPYHRFCVRSNGQLAVQEGTSKGSIFVVDEVPGATISYRFRSTAVPMGGGILYLGIRENGSLCTAVAPNEGCHVEGAAREVCATLFFVTTLPHTGPAAQGELMGWQYRRFLHEGFLVVEGAVGPNETDRCQRLLMHHLGILGSLHAGQLIHVVNM